MRLNFESRYGSATLRSVRKGDRPCGGRALRSRPKGRAARRNPSSVCDAVAMSSWVRHAQGEIRYEHECELIDGLAEVKASAERPGGHRLSDALERHLAAFGQLRGPECLCQDLDDDRRGLHHRVS